MLPEQQSLVLQALATLRQRFPDVQIEPQGIPDSAPIFRCTVEGKPCWIPFVAGDVQPCATLQEARRKVLTYDVQHIPHLQPGFGAMPGPADQPSRTGGPARALFETHELIRLPVQVDSQAKAFLDSGNQQTRLFAQALSEAFGAIAGVTSLTIAWAEPKDVPLPTLLITARAEDPKNVHFWHLRTEGMLGVTPTKELDFQARRAAAELVRLYIEHVNR